MYACPCGGEYSQVCSGGISTLVHVLLTDLESRPATTPVAGRLSKSVILLLKQCKVKRSYSVTLLDISDSLFDEPPT